MGFRQLFQNKELRQWHSLRLGYLMGTEWRPCLWRRGRRIMTFALTPSLISVVVAVAVYSSALICYALHGVFLYFERSRLGHSMWADVCAPVLQVYTKPCLHLCVPCQRTIKTKMRSQVIWWTLIIASVYNYCGNAVIRIRSEWRLQICGGSSYATKVVHSSCKISV